MYFWRIEELKAKLAAAPLTERETLPYLVVFAALAYAASALPSENDNVWDYLGIGWGLLLAIIGTLYAYRRNGGDSGSHFVQRYLAISWVVSIRWAVVAFLLFVVLMSVIETLEATTWHGFLFFAVAEAVLWQRIAHHIGDLAAGKAAPTS